MMVWSCLDHVDEGTYYGPHFSHDISNLKVASRGYELSRIRVNAFSQSHSRADGLF
jgi:hypothetical protein